jgi:hypothetical protein
MNVLKRSAFVVAVSVAMLLMFFLSAGSTGVFVYQGF